MLSAEAKRRAMAEARRMKVSFADFVRQAIDEKLPRGRGKVDRLGQRRKDPLFRLLDRLPLLTECPTTDVAANHDDYLYGDRQPPRGS